MAVWAPEYSSLTRFAVRTGLGLVYTAEDAGGLVERLTKLLQSQRRLAEMAEQTTRVAKTLFCPDAIHQQLVTAIQNLLASRL